MVSTSRRSVTSALPWLAGALALAAIVAVTVWIGRTNLESAKASRLDDRAALVSRFDRTGTEAYAAQVGAQFEDVVPFSPTDGGLNQLLLESVRTGPTGQPLVAALVVTADGEVAGALPPGTELPPGVVDEAIELALTHGTGGTNVFELDGEPVWAILNPVGGDDPWGALVMVEPLGDAWLQDLYENLGAFGPGVGGLTVVDSQGVVAGSWDPSRVGQPLHHVPEAGPPDHPKITTSEVDGERVVWIATHAPGSHSTLIYEERESTLYADLIDAQLRQDLVVILSALLVVLILAGFGVARRRTVRRSEARVRELLANARDIVAVVDADGALRYVSPAVTSIVGIDPDDVIGSRLVDILPPEDATAVQEALDEAMRTGQSSALGVQFPSIDGELEWFDLYLRWRPHPDIDGLLVTAHEVGDRRDLEEELDHRSHHDALTGLGNRVTFDQELAAAAGEEQWLAVTVIDLDRFKPLNDELGHDAGDRALQRIAELLLRGARASDQVCRLGGDEFGIVAPGTDPTSARALADRLVTLIAEGSNSAASVPLGASIGVAVARGPVTHPEGLVRDADGAMYQAKLQGGDRAVVVEVPPTPEARASVIEPRTAEAISSASSRTTDDGESPPPDVPPGAVDRSPSRPTVRGVVTWTLTVALFAAAMWGLMARNDMRIGHLEDERLEDRARVSQAIAGNTSRLLDLDKLVPVVEASPWPFEESPEVVDYVLSRYASAAAVGDGGLAVALDRDGSLVAAYPPGASVALDPDDPLLLAALEGETAVSPVIQDGDVSRQYLIVPIPLDGRIDHVLVMGTDTQRSGWSNALITLGALSDTPGGVTLVDQNGVAYVSWNPAVLGERFIDPDLLAELEDDPLKDHDAPGGMVRIALPVPDSHTPSYAIWSQSRESLFGDLRAGQRVRDLAVAGVFALALIGLTVANRRREAQLRRSEQLVDALLREAHDVIVVTDNRLCITYVSAAAERHLGADRRALAGHPLSDLLGSEATEALRSVVPDLTPGARHEVERITVVATSGETHHFDIDMADLRDRPGIGAYLFTCHEVSARTELERMLAERASRDPLTGLVNRARFGVHLDDLSERRSRTSGSDSDAVVFIDLDHFKPVNDEFGHQAGDRLLQVIATRLQESVRSGDIVCRLGGDEFAVLLADCDLPTAERTAQRLLGAIRQPVTLDEGIVALDASIGVALSRQEITNAEQLVREADQAMYEAKRAGRGRYVIDEPCPG